MFKNSEKNDLEKLLDDRNKLIENLKTENRKLAEELLEYKKIGASVGEFQQIVKKSNGLNGELEDLKKEYLKMNRGYKRDMERLFKNMEREQKYSD